MAEEFRSTTRLPELTQQLAAGSPMSPIYISPEDALRVTLINSHPTANYAFVGRLLRADGATIPLLQQLLKTTDGTSVITIIQLAEGYLLSGAVMPLDDGPQRGECYARMALVRGTAPGSPSFAILATGYTSVLQPLIWPWGVRNEEVYAVPGMYEVIRSSGALGQPYSLMLPPARAWFLKSVSFRLNTSAVAGNRAAFFLILESGNAIVAIHSSYAQQASGEHFYGMGQGLFAMDATGLPNHTLPLMQEMMLLPGWEIRIGASGMDAGDTISTVLITLESFLYVATGV